MAAFRQLAEENLKTQRLFEAARESPIHRQLRELDDVQQRFLAHLMDPMPKITELLKGPLESFERADAEVKALLQAYELSECLRLGASGERPAYLVGDPSAFINPRPDRVAALEHRLDQVNTRLTVTEIEVAGIQRQLGDDENLN